MPRKACKTGTSGIHKTGQKSTSIIKRWVLIFCEEFVNATSHAKHSLSHSIFLIWPHFYDKFLEKYIRLIFLPHFTTTAYGLYHSRYSFRQIHFRHLIFHVRLLCNMIVDIHCNLCIWMFFAPLRSVLNGCPLDIQHPITYCITLGLTLFSPSLVHPVWRRVCDEIGGISSGSRFSSSASLLSFLL